MKSEKRDRAYLWDMRQFARDSRKIVQRISFARLEQDLFRMLALERSLELIGEAARRVSEDAQAANPSIEWRALIGQRNVLAHDYGEIDRRLLYDNARQKIPLLLAELDRILGDEK
jgi:uncharacterized protein with HEPN domain